MLLCTWEHFDVLAHAEPIATWTQRSTKTYLQQMQAHYSDNQPINCAETTNDKSTRTTMRQAAINSAQDSDQEIAQQKQCRQQH